MKERTAEIIKSLEDAFFNEQFFKHLSVADNVLACLSLKDFRKLKIDFSSPEIESIFEGATVRASVNAQTNPMTQARALQLFDQAKAVRANITFI